MAAKSRRGLSLIAQARGILGDMETTRSSAFPAALFRFVCPGDAIASPADATESMTEAIAFAASADGRRTDHLGWH